MLPSRVSVHSYHLWSGVEGPSKNEHKSQATVTIPLVTFCSFSGTSVGSQLGSSGLAPHSLTKSLSFTDHSKGASVFLCDTHKLPISGQHTEKVLWSLQGGTLHCKYEPCPNKLLINSVTCSDHIYSSSTKSHY